MNKHSNNIFVMNMMIIIYLYVLYVYIKIVVSTRLKVHKSHFRCQTSGSLSLHTTSFSKRALRSLSSFSSHASIVGVWKFAESFAIILRSKYTWACKSLWKDALHNSKAASSTHQDKQVLSMDKTLAKKTLPKLETMDGRVPFFRLQIQLANDTCMYTKIYI